MIIKSHHFNLKNFTSQDIVKTIEGLSTLYGDTKTCMNKGLVYKKDVCRTPRDKKE